MDVPVRGAFLFAAQGSGEATIGLQGSMKFRYDINALRALAVASVILFHYKVDYFPGGYVGVDVFRDLRLSHDFYHHGEIG